MKRYIVHTTVEVSAERAHYIQKMFNDWLESGDSPVLFLSGCSVLEVEDE